MTIIMMQRTVPHVASEDEPASNLYSNFSQISHLPECYWWSGDVHASRDGTPASVDIA